MDQKEGIISYELTSYPSNTRTWSLVGSWPIHFQRFRVDMFMVFKTNHDVKSTKKWQHMNSKPFKGFYVVWMREYACMRYIPHSPWSWSYKVWALPHEWGPVHMGSKVPSPTNVSKSQLGGKVPIFEPRGIIKMWLIIIEAKSPFIYVKICANTAGSSFLLDQTHNPTSRKCCVVDIHVILGT